jgi:thiol-disulfide isomerase/thioredoxin
MKQLILLFLCAACRVAVAQEQHVQPFTFSPARPIAGEEITISYKHHLGKLASSQQIRGVIYLCTGDDWQADDLAMIPGDTAWTATYRLPGDCVLLACKFHGDDGASDSGTRWTHYGAFASERVNGEPATRQGAYLNWGLLRYKPFERHAIPGYSPEEECIEDNVMQMWIKNEYRYFPASREMLPYFAARMLEKSSPGEHHHLFVQDIDYILQLEAPAELSLLRAAETCRSILRDETRARAVDSIILQRYPDGALAAGREARRLFMLADPDEKERALARFMERFPPANFDRVNTDDYRLFFPKTVSSVVQHQINTRGEHDLLLAYLPVVPSVLLAEFYYRAVQLPLKHELKTHAAIAPLSTAIYNEMLLRASRGEERLYATAAGRRFSPAEWKQELTRARAGYYFTHADILHHAGENAPALEILESIKEVYGNASSDYNDLYARLLEANGYRQLVIPFIEACARVDATTPAMLETLRADFLARDPAGDFDRHVASLRSAGFVAREEERLVASLIREEIAPFALEDTRGNRVEMAALKGKVIVLDFWATWCSPCKAALPGMQMAVDRYRDDPRVAFYFISTLEHDPNYKQAVRDFITSKHYSLEVLFDNVDPATGKHGALYHAYGLNGIPHKMIIDGDGLLRWSSSGYYGNPVELANEITFLVNHLLEEKK